MLLEDLSVCILGEGASSYAWGLRAGSAACVARRSEQNDRASGDACTAGEVRGPAKGSANALRALFDMGHTLAMSTVSVMVSDYILLP